MADDAGEKTEDPTGKKLSEARSKGMIGKSSDFNSAFMLLTGTVLIWMFGDRLVDGMRISMVESFRMIGNFQRVPEDLVPLLRAGFLGFLLMLLPIVGGIAVVGVAINLAQVGFLWTMEPLGPNFGKIFGPSGWTRLFSPQSFLEIAKSVAKMAVVGLVGYQVVAKHYLEYLALADMEVGQFCSLLFGVCLEVVIKSVLVLLMIGIADLIYQKRKTKKELRMSKQEIKDEAKSSEGDPHIRGKIKSLRQQMHRNMMMKELPKATVVITNPTFIAIAIRYEQGQDQAPVVVAKGKRLIAERIRDTARKHDIPIVEDKPLARSLFDVAEVGEEIPPEFFAAVAEILAYVYNLKGQRAT